MAKKRKKKKFFLFKFLAAVFIVLVLLFSVQFLLQTSNIPTSNTIVLNPGEIQITVTNVPVGLNPGEAQVVTGQ